jgi:hypothetical protein
MFLFAGVPPNCTGVSLCHSVPCLNGGSCADLGDHYNCTCPAGFTGKGVLCFGFPSVAIGFYCLSREYFSVPVFSVVLLIMDYSEDFL